MTTMAETKENKQCKNFPSPWYLCSPFCCYIPASVTRLRVSNPSQSRFENSLAEILSKEINDICQSKVHASCGGEGGGFFRPGLSCSSSLRCDSLFRFPLLSRLLGSSSLPAFLLFFDHLVLIWPLTCLPSLAPIVIESFTRV